MLVSMRSHVFWWQGILWMHFSHKTELLYTVHTPLRASWMGRCVSVYHENWFIRSKRWQFSLPVKTRLRKSMVSGGNWASKSCLKSYIDFQRATCFLTLKWQLWINFGEYVRPFPSASLVDYKTYVLVFYNMRKCQMGSAWHPCRISKRLDQTTFSERLLLCGDAHSGWWCWELSVNGGCHYSPL